MRGTPGSEAAFRGHWVLVVALFAAGCGAEKASVKEQGPVTEPEPETITLTVSMRLDGGGTADVISNPAGIVCSDGTCTATFPRGSPVSLTATPGSAQFVRWSGACVGASTSCEVSGSADATVHAVFLGANYVFVTSTSHAAVGLTLPGADAECAARAADAGLPGTYVAWLSTSTVNAASRLGSARGWVRTDGRPFADSVTGLTAGNRIMYPPRLDEWGSAPERIEVLTGTYSDGALLAGYNCGDWTSTVGNLVFGHITAGPSGWTYIGGTSCAGSFTGHLYCFGTDATRVLAPSPALGRIAFLSQPTTLGTGVAGLDAQCAAEASAALLSGTFKALVATSTATATSRFDLVKDPWTRVDGVAVVTAAADIANKELLAPVAVGATGTYRTDDRVWTGALSPTSVGTVASTCADWTDGSGTGTGAFGFPVETEGPPPPYKGRTGFFSVGMMPDPATMSCSAPAAVYCLQE